MVDAKLIEQLLKAILEENYRSVDIITIANIEIKGQVKTLTDGVKTVYNINHKQTIMHETKNQNNGESKSIEISIPVITTNEVTIVPPENTTTNIKTVEIKSPVIEEPVIQSTSTETKKSKKK